MSPRVEGSRPTSGARLSTSGRNAEASVSVSSASGRGPVIFGIGASGQIVQVSQQPPSTVRVIPLLPGDADVNGVVNKKDLLLAGC